MFLWFLIVEQLDCIFLNSCDCCLSGCWDSERSTVVVSWLPMRGSIEYSSHREWGYHRAHVHAGLVNAFCTLNDLMINFLICFWLKFDFFFARHMRPQHWQRRGTFGHWDTRQVWKMEALWYGKRYGVLCFFLTNICPAKMVVYCSCAENSHFWSWSLYPLSWREG